MATDTHVAAAQHVDEPVSQLEKLEAAVMHKHPRELREQSLGTRAAGWVAVGAGSWAFIFIYLAFTAVWTIGNKTGLLTFDPYPYQFYTMLVSVLAILLAQVILLFQNRQAMLEERLSHNAYAQVDEIDRMQKQQTQILERLDQLIQEVHAVNVKVDEHVNG